jgi:DNA-binding MarR family transcriptional regulator
MFTKTYKRNHWTKPSLLQSDLRVQTVRLLMHLKESGPKKQSELVEELGLEAYAMSRLLAKLELHHYIVSRRKDRQDR